MVGGNDKALIMKTATLTFHGSHNYGSMLQAYALQQVMIEVFGENDILNFRSPRQKRMMRVISLRPSLGPILKDLTHLLYYPALKAKHSLFELFMREKLRLSPKEIATVSQNDIDGYDLLCCGSDQIWNPCPEDFDLAYLLPFKFHAKKISYAASMGPGQIKWPEPISKFPELLKDFDKISVREKGTKTLIQKLCGRDDIIANCDPVFLLEKNDWLKIIDDMPIIKSNYIFLYTLYANSLIINCAKTLSKQYNLPVIISNYTNIHDLFSPFKKHLKSGPLEFLNLLYHSKMVVTSSFHGAAFSTILNKPFAVVNGLKDNRISNLLCLTGLESRSVSSTDDIARLDWDVDFSKANESIAVERGKGIEYLISCRQDG